jgi:hypothetical protein
MEGPPGINSLLPRVVMVSFTGRAVTISAGEFRAEITARSSE